MKFLLFALLVIWQQPLMCPGHPYFPVYDENNMTYLSEARVLAKRGCIDSCGEVLIPYPFGIRSVGGGGSNCYYNESYEIICNTSFGHPRPFLKILDLEVMGIALSDEFYSMQAAVAVRMRLANVCSRGYASSPHLQGTPYRYSVDGNVFIAQGCSGIMVRNKTGDILTACTPTCMSNTTTTTNTLNSSLSCHNGIGCCRASFDTEGIADIDFFNISVSQDNDVVVGSSHEHGCNTTVALIDSEYGYSSDFDQLGTILRWMAPEPLSHYGEHANVSCYQQEDDVPYPWCQCNPPYLGNPYLPYGCQVDCSYFGDYHHCKRRRLLRLAIILGVSIGTGVVLLLLCGYWLYRFVQRTIEIKRKSKNFKRNGGLLLQQQLISTTKGIVEKTKIFTLLELERITDNFNENRILGQGGQGTVYKGMMEDGKIVAIKKSKKVDEDQLEQFINEVVIVSQINHRNVVKLLGCCLETEVPLLVYEFIPNGTLYHHIHNTSEDIQLSWKMRLQIATESAWALSHLHSSTSPPIYHRDIKSSNILLDDKCRAKVSDFGTSKAITIDQTHVTTCVQGTYGYLDPEYFQSNQFTDKSDVYSFGVVLIELITGMKPITPTKSGGWISLASEFLFHMESCILDDILDTRVLEEGKKEELVAVAKIARQCLKRNGKRRPTMKEVAKLLDEIRSPYQENLTQLNYTEISPILEMNEMHNRSFSNVEMASCSYIEGQPLIVNTF